MSDEPSVRRALLLLEHRRNRELLDEWLRAQAFETTPARDGDRVDLVIADAAAFAASRERLVELKERTAPAYLPLVLVVSASQAAHLPGGIWHEVDEVLTTPIRQAELRLRIERLLAIRGQSLQTARRLAELGRSNTDLQQFAYAAAHELSNPLTAVTGVIDTIAVRHRDGLDPQAAELLAVAQQESERLQRLIGDLLAYSQVGTVVRPGDVDLGELVAETLAGLERQMAASRATVETGRLPRVWGDEGQLHLVVANLLRNALKYHRAGEPPRIRIWCEEEDGRWIVSVADNGIGIAEEQSAVLFDMFARGAGGAQGDGHGIGLALCRRAVERHGGEIWVDPAPGGGSVFRFSLPRPDSPAR